MNLLHTTVLLSATMLVPLAHAVETTANGPLRDQVSWSALQNMINRTDATVKGHTALLNQIVLCGKKQRIYGPGTNGADSDGCVQVQVILPPPPPPPPPPPVTYSPPPPPAAPACTASAVICDAYAKNTGRLPDQDGAAYWQNELNRDIANGYTAAEAAARLDIKMNNTAEVITHQTTGAVDSRDVYDGRQGVGTSKVCSGGTNC